MYPNGYNRRWNTNYKDRSLIEKEKEEVPLIFEEKNEASSIDSILEELDKMVKESKFLNNICFYNLKTYSSYVYEEEEKSEYNYQDWNNILTFICENHDFNKRVIKNLKSLLVYC